jgi:hypothetical protein
VRDLSKEKRNFSVPRGKRNSPERASWRDDPKKIALKLLSRVVTDYEMDFFTLGSAVAPTVEIDGKLKRRLFLPIQGDFLN